jgi:hypothetical protein
MYFVLLSCLPCADDEGKFTFDKGTTFKQVKEHLSLDACSALCVCNCCGNQSLSFSAIFQFDFSTIKSTIENGIPLYKTIFISNFFESIWQPPQIM